MTIKTQMDFSPEDVASLEVECVRCGTSVRYPVTTRVDRAPECCPNCNENFRLPSGATLEGMAQAVERVLNQLTAPTNRFRVRFGLFQSAPSREG